MSNKKEFLIEGQETQVASNDNVYVLSSDGEVDVNKIIEFEKKFHCDLMSVRPHTMKELYQVNIIFKRKTV